MLSDKGKDQSSLNNWKPIDGIGELIDEQFVGNYMIDSNTSVGHFVFYENDLSLYFNQ